MEKETHKDQVIACGTSDESGAQASAHAQSEMAERMKRISEEFKQGFDLIKKYPKSVSVFGSARMTPDNLYYQKAKSVAKKISELGYAVITGGGPGIMAGANEGAFEAGGHSVGLNIELPHEQFVNEYVTQELEFHYFFSRKMILSFSAEAYVFFPGGFGTMDEFFEIATLVQEKKIKKVPIVCVGSEYWNELDGFIKNTLRDTFKTIAPEDTDVYQILDDEDKILEIIKNAPMRDE